MRFSVPVFLLLVLSLLVACDSGSPGSPAASAPAERPVLVATNYPMAWLAERLAGDLAAVELPVPPDEDPAYWQPGADDVRAMQKADLILLNGAGYEKWLPTVSLPANRLVDTGVTFKGEWIRIKDATTHSHGAEGEHVHTGTDFNTWLDPRNLERHAGAVAAALVQWRPDQADTINARLADVRRDLQSLDRDLAAAFAPLQGRPVLASHPVYDYLARRCAIDLKSVHWEPGIVPGDEEWLALEALHRDHPATLMLWEDDPAEATRLRLQEMGITPLTFHTANNRPPQGDYLDVMRANIIRLEAALASP